MVPSGSFNVDASGRGCPVGQTVMKSRLAGGTTVMLNEYAPAIDGIEQFGLDCIGKVRGLRGSLPQKRFGGPNGPLNPCPERVSTTRHGVIPTKTSALAGEVAST